MAVFYRVALIFRMNFFHRDLSGYCRLPYHGPLPRHYGCIYPGCPAFLCSRRQIFFVSDELISSQSFSSFASRATPARQRSFRASSFIFRQIFRFFFSIARFISGSRKSNKLAQPLNTAREQQKISMKKNIFTAGDAFSPYDYFRINSNPPWWIKFIHAPNRKSLSVSPTPPSGDLHRFHPGILNIGNA